MWLYRYECSITLYTIHAQSQFVALLSRIHTPSAGRLLLTPTSHHTLTHTDPHSSCTSLPFLSRCL